MRVVVGAAFVLAACSPPGTDAPTTSEQAVTERLAMIQDAVTDWAEAPTLADADACVIADVLGGSWEDPGARWVEALAVYDAWTPADNTMPQLASHPQRIVGWATLTLATDNLDEAHEYAGHAQIHIDVSVRAISACG